MRIKFNSLLYKTNRFHVAVRLFIIDHRRRQNVVRTSVTHSAIASCATFLFLPHFDVICDLLLNRRTATWNLFVKYIYIYGVKKGTVKKPFFYKYIYFERMQLF